MFALSRAGLARAAAAAVVVFAAAPAFASEGAAPLPVMLLGRLHFPLLHFPIVLLGVVALIDVAWKTRFVGDGVRGLAGRLLGLAAVSGVVVAAAGLAYAAGEDFSGPSHDTFVVHRGAGIAVAFATVAAYFARQGTGALRTLYPFLLSACVIGVLYVGHEGGEMVHGHGFFTKPLRGDTKPASTGGGDDVNVVSYDDGDGAAVARDRHPEGAIPEKPDYTKDIKPIFERSCVKCHGPEKRKSGLRLDEKRFAMKGGESGPKSIVPGQPEQSLVFSMCAKPSDDEDVMPPKGKLLALSEVETLKRWIEQGAAWPE